MADYTQPKDVEKRLRYFNGQFLREQDFIDEQKFHLDRQRRHQRLFHAPGIAEGLAVAASGSSITVAPGTAIDASGRSLVLTSTETISLASALGTTRRLVISYRTIETDQSQTGSISYTRFQEKPELAVLTLDDAVQDRVVLARLTISSAGAVTIDLAERQYAGVLLPGGASLRLGATGKLDASAGLRVTGDSELSGSLTVGTTLGVNTTTVYERQQIANAFAFHDGSAAKVLAFGWAPSSSRALLAGIPAEIRWDPTAGSLHLGTDNTARAAGATTVAMTQTLTLKQGSVGIGTTAPTARLSVVAPGATELTATTRSATLLTNSGTLGATAGTELVLGSLGVTHTSSNQTMLGIRAIRATAGSDWTTTAVGLGMDVDATVRAGAHLWLHANKNIGVGTSAPVKSLHIQQSGSSVAVLTEERRPGIAIAGEYPDLTLFSGVNNNNHGPTIMLGSYNDDTRQTHKHWSIGTAGRNANFLDIGFGANDANPHNGIRNLTGRTVMTLTENGNVGIGPLSPQDVLDVSGNTRLLSGGNPLRFTSQWSGFPDNASNQAEIANDTYAYKTLMLIGNKSSGTRKVSVWDRLEVNGTLAVSSHMDVGGNLTMTAQSQIYASGRLHIHGSENLYLLNRGGVIVSKAWEGNGNLIVEGRLGVYGQSPDPRHGWDGGIHTWDLEAEGAIWSAHDVMAKGTFRGNYADLAENYLSDSQLEPGDVVCLAADSDTVVRSERPNDLGVCGVISTEPGMVLNSDIDRPDDRLFPVALCGRVPCKVTDQNGPIRRGDLLTSSSTPGHAMRAQPVEIDGQRIFRPGSIIGKALGAHSSGSGVIDVFVTLS